MTVWITRTRPGADQTAGRLRALGVEVLVDPVLEVRRLDVEVDASGYQALAFTSPNGVEAFCALSAERDLPAFAVGDATAAALRLAGFASVESASGDVEALAALLLARRAGRVLAPGAAEPAADLGALATGPGVEVTALPVYETVERHPERALTDAGITTVMIHSPRAARQVLAVASDRLPRVDFVALSAACAAPFEGQGAKSVAVAPFPDDASLVRLTADVVSKAP